MSYFKSVFRYISIIRILIKKVTLKWKDLSNSDGNHNHEKYQKGDKFSCAAHIKINRQEDTQISN